MGGERSPRGELVVGTRGSALAQWQTEWVIGRIAALLPLYACEPLVIRTRGDRVQDLPLAAIGAEGLFVKELEEHLLERRIDLAVHSLKDLPTRQPEGLVVAAYPEREDPSDALVSVRYRSLADLPEGARVGTGSPRRRAQLAAVRPDLRFAEIRGNLDTRLAKLSGERLEGEPYDAIVLACAGLRRLGKEGWITQVLPPETCLPAPGQGILALEVRSDDRALASALLALDHPETRAAAVAERTLLRLVEGGCQAPLGTLARVEHGQLRLEAALVSPDGRQVIRKHRTGSLEAPEALGEALARELLSAGGDALMAAIRAGFR